METKSVPQPNVAPPAPDPAGAAPPPAASATGVRNTVLVVDDEPAVLRLVTSGLKHFGFSVLTAADGHAAVALCQQHRDEIGCVLCDVTMPGLDGWGTLAALRQLVPGLPVIFTSGFDESQVMEIGYPEEPQAFLHKPYSFQALNKVVRQLMSPALLGQDENGTAGAAIPPDATPPKS